MTESFFNELKATLRLGLPLALTQAIHPALHVLLMIQIAGLDVDLFAGAAMGLQAYLLV